MRYQRAEVKAGLFVTLASVALFSLFVWLTGYLAALLTGEYYYFTLLQDAEGINAGAVVHFAGIPAGHVVDLGYYPEGIPADRMDKYDLVMGSVDKEAWNFNADTGKYSRVDGASVLLVFSLKQEYGSALRGDAVAEIEQAIFGGATVNVSPGSHKEELPKGGYLRGAASVMSTLVGELDNLRGRFRSVADKLETVLGNVGTLTAPGANLDKTLAGFADVSANIGTLTLTMQRKLDALLTDQMIVDLQTTAARLRNLMENADSAIAAHLEPTLASLERLSGQFEDLLARNQGKIDLLIENAGGTFGDLRELSGRLTAFVEKLDGALGDSEEGFLALPGELQGVVQHADGLIADVRARIAEFKWSYLHYILFSPDASEQSAGQSLDLARELVNGQERMAAALVAVEKILTGPKPLDAELRKELEARREELRAGLARSDELQNALFSRMREGAGAKKK